MSSLKRISAEFKEINDNPVDNCSAQIIDDNLFNWRAQIYGPQGTPYEGGIFNLNILFPSEYPFKPPKINFETKVYHPNINNTGIICMDILKDNWSPLMTITKVLLSICSLLNDPNPIDPLEPDIANEFLKNKDKYIENAKSWTLIYANPN